VVVRNPFNPFLSQAPATAVANLERRAEMAAQALQQARRDLEAARQRIPVEDDDDKADGRYAQYRRQGALDERERIKAILTAPVAARQPRLAEAYAFKSDDSADKAIAMMEAADRADAESRAKTTAYLIILAGKRARGLVACEVMAGPKVFVKMTPEAIIAAARKAGVTD
jgi:hypothetical protein